MDCWHCPAHTQLETIHTWTTSWVRLASLLCVRCHWTKFKRSKYFALVKHVKCLLCSCFGFRPQRALVYKRFYHHRISISIFVDSVQWSVSRDNGLCCVYRTHFVEIYCYLAYVRTWKTLLRYTGASQLRVRWIGVFVCFYFIQIIFKHITNIKVNMQH